LYIERAEDINYLVDTLAREQSHFMSISWPHTQYFIHLYEMLALGNMSYTRSEQRREYKEFCECH
jgi:hypothetical protein